MKKLLLLTAILALFPWTAVLLVKDGPVMDSKGHIVDEGVPFSPYIGDITNGVTAIINPGSTTYFQVSDPDGKPMVRFGSDGSFQLSDGITTSEAASRMALIYRVDCNYDYNYTIMFFNKVGLKPNGEVSYTDFTPPPKAAEFFQLLADRLACPGATKP